MGGMFGGGKAPQSQKQQPAGALNVQTSIYGSAYPLVYGKNRVPVNLIHYVNFKSIAHTTKQKTGGKGGGGKSTNTTYTYQVAMAASCFVGGPNTGIGTVWKNKEKHSLASLGLTFFGGAAGQTAWSYLTGSFPAQAVPYANLAYIAGSAFQLGDSPSLPNLNVEALGLKRYNPGVNDDALLSDIVVDYLTDTRHGAGFGGYLADLDVGPASFRKYCLARGLFISPIENNQRNAGAFLKELSEISNSAMVWKNGKLHFIPYGDATITGNGATYTPDLTPLYDLTVADFLFEKNQPPVKHSAKNPSQQFNHVRVEYNNRANDYNPSIAEVKDEADIDDNGLRTKPVRKCTAITLAAVARDVAQLEMQRDLFVSNNYSFRLGVRHSLLEPMDYVTITEASMGLDRQLVRIIDVVEQDDAIDVTVEEVNIGVASAPLYNTVGPQGYNQDFNVSPGDTQDPLIMNAPGLLTPTGYEMWINACGVNFDLWGGCEVWISDDNAEYRYVGSIMGPARYGALAANLAAGSNDYDTTSVARVQLYSGQMLGGTQEDVDDWRTLLYVGGEWMSYRDAVLVSGTTYDLDTFRRAGYGSVRAAHSTGQAVAVIDEATFRMPYDKGNVGKTVYLKFPAFNVFGGGRQDLASVTAHTHTIGASEMTAPMIFADIGGNGVNLLPDQYSTYENTTLPALVVSNLTASRDATFKKVSASLLLQRQTVGTSGFVFFCPSLGWNIQHTAGKRYIVSFYYLTNSIASGSVALQGNSPIVDTAEQPLTFTADGQWRRVSALCDASALTAEKVAIRLTVNGPNGSDIRIDGVMIEEAVGTLNNPSAYSRGTPANVALSALITALSAQATADGQVDIYRQSTAPSIGGAGAKYGDYWQDSDDGKWYFCNGSSWIESTDNRVPQAIVDASTAQGAANTAQTTANARIRLFVQDATPSAGSYIVGDMWYRPSYKDTYYWNGTGWSKNADTFEAATDSLVFNPSFEQADLYWNRDTGMYTEVNAAALNGTRIMVFSASLGNPNARALNAKSIPVRPGQVLSVIGNVGKWQLAANGAAAIGLVFYNKDGAYVGEKNISYETAPATGAQADAFWRTVTGKITVPYGAVKAHANMLVTSCTSGFWVFDNVRIAFQDNEPRAVASGENFVVNSNFGQNKGQFPIAQYLPIRNELVVDGWVLDTVNGDYSTAVSVGLEGYGSGGQQQQVFVGDAGGTLGSDTQIYLRSTDTFSVEPGEVFVIRSEGVVDIGNAKPAGVNIFQFAGMNCYNKEGADVGYLGRNVTNYAGYWLTEDVVTIPAGTAFVRPVFGAYWQNTSGGAKTMPWATSHCRFRQLNIRRRTNLDQTVITDGTTYGRTANQDLYDSGGVRRIGVNVKGSRKILGGARNSRASIVYGAASVRTATALSATSAGAVTVNAHNVEISGETVTYNAVANAVTGLSVGQTYVIFTLDPFLDGGTRTYYAQSTVLNAQQAGEGAVFIGNITIPSGGSGSGGGGGGGNPGDWCVDWDTVLPDGSLLRDLRTGDVVRCVDMQTGEVSFQPLLAMGIGEEECYRLTTPELHSVVQSRSTPMDLPDGSVLTTEQMFGKPVYIMEDGTAKLSFVSDLQYLGKRRVLKPDFGNRMFFAGERAEATVATHNAQYKP